MQRINFMAKYTKSSGSQGAWVDKSELKTGMKAVIASEVEPSEGEYGKQDIGKISIEGGEAVNFRFNKPTINGLVEAYGEESSEWGGEKVILKVEDSRVAGKVRIVYLVPEGFEPINDDNGFLVIRKKDGEIPVINE